ncbi:MAG: Eco57I restriction-modification methylase domain-containing protein [Candidatus Bipolaricaulota bacterium]|nr:Eco57I restriction-modification methylase domain-containing protein [Candidatus Bipolaricaulota bacterium]
MRYLSIVEPASNGKILWGILTNGRLWRLYYHKAKSRTDGYIEFDLDPLLNPQSLFRLSLEERLEAFKLFYLFFRREAFVPTAERPNQTFLQFALEEGKNYEERVTEDLKQKIFEEVFILLARGFVEDAQHKGAAITQEFLDEVYKNVLTLLYRLLFILYAEDRDLLPVRDDRYDDYSLRKVRDEIERRIDKRDNFSQRATSYWDRLKTLFHMINDGDPSINVPIYNGGLFDPHAHPFLERYAISDSWLARALDLLSRDYKDSNRPRRINYRDLGVRQLGSIYEGLLEFKLRIAQEDLVVVKDKDGEHYLPKAEAEQKRKRILAEIKKDNLFITNDKSERKATGSYYTPDYIVQYIVENTLEPLVQRIEEEFERKREELKANRNLSARAKTVELADKHDPAMRVLELKVLDPAMGSGHFLVAAVDFLADRINSLLENHNGKKYFGDELYESPLYRQIEEVRQKIHESAAQQGIELDESKLEDKHIIKRMVMKRCIYGVDLNEMAVELAKVSLWLHSFTIGAPLSFLDHHLKCGNSLIGVFDVSDVIAASSPRYREFVQALRNMVLVGQLTDVTLAETLESKRLFDEAKSWLEPFRRKLDASLAMEHFMELTTDQRVAVQTALSQEEWKSPEIHSLLDQALEIARQKRFFHWKLEFPEVWYTERGPRANPGFDAVIGNPPYGSKKMLSPEDKDYIREVLEYTNSGDTAAMFTEQSFKLMNTGGYWGFIVPKPFSYITSWSDIREFILSQQLSHIGDVSKAFEEVLLEQVVLIAAKAPPREFVSIAVIKESELADIEKVNRLEFTSRLLPVYRFGKLRRLAQKVESMSKNLSHYVRIWAGIGGITKELSKEAVGPKILKGQSLARYEETEDIWYVPSNIPSERDYQEHDHKRIVAQDIVAHVFSPKDHIILMATLAQAGTITHETVINFTNTSSKILDSFLLGLLNSKLIS